MPETFLHPLPSRKYSVDIYEESTTAGDSGLLTSFGGIQHLGPKQKKYVWVEFNFKVNLWPGYECSSTYIGLTNCSWALEHTLADYSSISQILRRCSVHTLAGWNAANVLEWESRER